MIETTDPNGDSKLHNILRIIRNRKNAYGNQPGRRPGCYQAAALLNLIGTLEIKAGYRVASSTLPDLKRSGAGGDYDRPAGLGVA
jgi:hypothetical protein